MKLLILFLGFAPLTIFTCKKFVQHEVPDCIRKNIEANRDKPDWRIKSIEKYEYQGKFVYFYNPEVTFPDAQAFIINADCTTFCTLGGIAGNTICNGEIFEDKAKLIGTVWHK